jgi:glucose/arabinose dehydrogenase
MKSRFFAQPAVLIASWAFALRAELPKPDAVNGDSILPPGLRALVVADNLVLGRKAGQIDENLRFLAASPTGDLYANTYHNGISAPRDTEGDGWFDQRKEFGSGGGIAIALRGQWLYPSTSRYKLTPNRRVAPGNRELVVGRHPDGGNHTAKSFAFDGPDHLIVEVGSPYNVFSDDKAAGNMIMSFPSLHRFPGS